jgi:hypothetical protein
MTDVLITSEPRVYEPGSRHSFYLDRAAEGMPNVQAHRDAVDRLERYAKEIAVEIAAGSAEGRRAQGVFRAESRAMSATSVTSGAAMVTPQYLTELFVPYQSAARTFINQCQQVPMPTVGMVLNIPAFASAANATVNGDNMGIGDVDPAGSDLQANVVQVAGEVVISQQLFERGGDSGEAMDVIVQKQITQQLNAAEDAYAIQTAIAAGTTITDNVAVTIATWFQDLSSAREVMSDTAGKRIPATHIFTTSDISGYFTRQVDSQQRPIFLPDGGALIAADDNPKFAGWLGLVLPGHLFWYADDNIPANGANTQLIVSRPEEILFFEGDSVAFTYPQTFGNHLAVVVGARKYIAVQPRFPQATVVITGSAYPLTLI